MVRLFLEPPKGNAETAIDNWVQNYNEWESDPVEHTLAVTNTALDGSGVDYVQANYRFIQDSAATSLLDDLESRLQSLQGGLWYRIGYHDCNHDESNRDGCTWDTTETRENGTIPPEIPELT